MTRTEGRAPATTAGHQPLTHRLSAAAVAVGSAVARPGRRIAEVALRPVYAVYTERLRREVMARPRPRHVAVIMDGNRRWAMREGYADHRVGHRRGAEKALEMIDWCADLGIREVTLWALSVENLGRSDDEIGTITDVAADALSALAEGRRKTRVPVHLRVIGRRELLPERLREVVDASAGVSRPDGSMDVTIALAYSGRDELLEAFRATLREMLAAGVTPDALADGVTGGGRRGSSLHARLVGPGPDRQDERRSQDERVPALAERLQRVLLLRRVLAGLPPDRLPARDPDLPGEIAPIRALIRGGRPRGQSRGRQATGAAAPTTFGTPDSISIRRVCSR